MSVRFISTILAVAATITTFAALPAKADSDDVKRVLRTAAGLYIAGQLYKEFQNNGTVRVHGSHGYGPRHYSNRHDGPRAGYGHGYRNHHWKKPPLPRRCLREVRSKKTRYALGARCMLRNYRAMNRLPERCIMRFGHNGHKRWGYSLRCLRKSGFQLASRHYR